MHILIYDKLLYGAKSSIFIFNTFTHIQKKKKMIQPYNEYLHAHPQNM